MKTREHALMLAQQYRTCPPVRAQNEPEFAMHLKDCPPCSMEKEAEEAPWRMLVAEAARVRQRELEDKHALGPKPGQLRLMKALKRPWRENRYYNPPVVLVLETGLPREHVRAALTFHDTRLSAEGDLVVSTTDADGFLVEAWNGMVVHADRLGPVTGFVSQDVVDAVRTLADNPRKYPSWARIPRPLGANNPYDPRQAFRALEREVARVFAGLQMITASGDSGRRAVEQKAQGICWDFPPKDTDQVLALARFSDDRMPLAASEKSMRPANLVVLREGEMSHFAPLQLTLLARTGNLTVGGCISPLPKGSPNSRLICYLCKKGIEPVPSASHRWDSLTGNFTASFDVPEGFEGEIRAAVVVSEDET